MRIYLKSSGELMLCFKIVSIGGKMLVFTLGASKGTKLWFNEKE